MPKPSRALTYWEFDTQFIYIHHLVRYEPMLSVVDVVSCYIIRGIIQWSIKRENVVVFFNAPPEDYTMPREIFLGCDNGSVFENGIVRAYFKSEGITRESTEPTIPEQNAHIES